MASVKTAKEISEMIALAEECPDFEGMTYQDGVLSALLWVQGDSIEAPYNEDDKE